MSTDVEISTTIEGRERQTSFVGDTEAQVNEAIAKWYADGNGWRQAESRNAYTTAAGKCCVVIRQWND
jgi:hypothetical protein